MSKTEDSALRAITTYARKNIAPNLKILDLHFDKARGAWVASAVGKVGTFEVTAQDKGSTFEVSHFRHDSRIDAGAVARSHSHVANQTAAAFLVRGVVFAAIAAGMGMGYMVGKPQVEKLLAQAQKASEPQPKGKVNPGSVLGGSSAMLEAAEKLADDPKANAAMKQFIKKHAGEAAGKLDTLQQLNSTGQ